MYTVYNMEYKIITAANDAYINTIVNFIENFVDLFDPHDLIVYDLGFNEINLDTVIHLKEKYGFQLKQFDYTLYPDHVNLNMYNGLYCSYAFKPIIIFNEANIHKGRQIIWMDSANRFDVAAIQNIYTTVKQQGLYTPVSCAEKTIETIELNHPNTVNLLGLTEFEHKNNLKTISANLVCFDYSSNSGFQILNDWYNCSLQKNIIMPEGSSRNNHRQDQTVLSVLIYKYEKNNNMLFERINVGVKFWNKYDKGIMQSDHYPFKLIDRKTNIQLAIIYCINLDQAILVYSHRKGIDPIEFLRYYIVSSV